MASRVSREWDDGFVVRRMTRRDAEKVISWYTAVCATSVDLQVALDVAGDDEGFYVGELNGELVASAAVIAVADGLSYGSMLYVDERFRDSGLGRRIIDVAMEAAVRTARNTIAIDAHSELEAMFVRRGGKTQFAVTQFTGKVQPVETSGKSELAIRQVGNSDFDGLMRYDDECFVRPGSAWRREFMSRLIMIPGSRTMIAVNQQGDVVGCGCRRPAVAAAEHHLIGPLYADSYDIARQMLYALTCDIAGQNIWISICEPNEEAVRLLRELKLHESIHMMRMMLGNGDLDALSHRVFGITSIDVCGF